MLMFKIKKLEELSENEGFKVMIGTTDTSDKIDAFYPELVPDFGLEDTEFRDKYFKFLDGKKNLIKQLKLLEKVKKKVILVYVDNEQIVSTLKEFLDSKTRIIIGPVGRIHG